MGMDMDKRIERIVNGRLHEQNVIQEAAKVFAEIIEEKSSRWSISRNAADQLKAEVLRAAGLED